ncbi:hypothetical protein ACFL6Y_06450 [Elusimicrobiota bacterium]
MKNKRAKITVLLIMSIVVTVTADPFLVNAETITMGKAATSGNDVLGVFDSGTDTRLENIKLPVNGCAGKAGNPDLGRQQNPYDSAFKARRLLISMLPGGVYRGKTDDGSWCSVGVFHNVHAYTSASAQPDATAIEFDSEELFERFNILDYEYMFAKDGDSGIDHVGVTAIGTLTELAITQRSLTGTPEQIRVFFFPPFIARVSATFRRDRPVTLTVAVTNDGISSISMARDGLLRNSAVSCRMLGPNP